MKKKISCALLSFLIVLTSSSTVLAEKKNGFDVNTKNYNIKWSTIQRIDVLSEKGGKLGTLSYMTGLARKKNSNDYIVMTKEIMTPNQKKVKTKGVLSGYGYSDLVTVETTLPSLNDYEPKNRPLTRDSMTISLGASAGSKGGSGEIGVSYTISHQDLDITSKCSTPARKYKVEYDYIPDLCPFPNHNNKYISYESDQYGLAEFTSNKKTIDFTVKYNAKFGTAMNEARSALAIYTPGFNEWGNCINRSYSYTISK